MGDGLLTATPDRRDGGAPFPAAVWRLAADQAFSLDVPVFKCLFMVRGTAAVRFGERQISLVGPCVLCLDDREGPALPWGGDAWVVVFRPQLFNGGLDVDHLRGCPQSIDVSTELDLYWMAAYLSRPHGLPEPIPLDPLGAARLEQWMAKIRVELESQECRFWKAWARSYLSEVLFVLGAAWHSNPLQGQPAQMSLKDPRDADPMKSVVDYLHCQYHRPEIGIEDLARHFATNRTSLQRAFRAYTGRSVMDYLRLFRLSTARTLLECGGETITDISLSVGFQDISGFERAFHRVYGLSPTAYRRLKKGERAGTQPA